MSCTESCDISKWTPPTPQSVLIPLPSKQLHPPALDLPDPSLLTSRNCPYDEATRESHPLYHCPSSSELARLLNPNLQPSCTERATPGSLIMPQAAGTAAGDPQPMRRDILRESAVKSPGISSVQSDDDDDEDDDPSYTSSESRKRPRRESAVAAARLIPRQPSPFELSPPPSRGTSAGGAQSNRKVSHSLIERRRRERINDCLSHLKQVVPQCRAEGEKKVAKAKERGRKRGRKGGEIMADEAQRGGLHKLEILQGTIHYVEELEARVLHLEARLGESKYLSLAADSASSTSPDFERPSLIPSKMVVTTSSSASHIVDHLPQPLSDASSLSPSSALAPSSVDEATAELLLNLSTSPELRPIHFQSDQ